MANGYFERGEIYWIRIDSAFDFEKGVGRPGVILSCDAHNKASSSISVAFCSKQPQAAWGVEMTATGCVSYIQVSQVSTIDKARIGKYLGVLNRAETKALDECLEKFFDLGYVDDTAVKEKETEIAARDIQIKELREEITNLKAEIAAHDDGMAVKVEIAMWQRLYEKALDQLCSMKLTGDITRRVEKAPAVNVAPVRPVEPEPEAKLVDINTAKFAELKKCGFSDNVAVTVINRRPYNSVEDLKKVPGINGVMYGILSKKVCCTKVAPVVSAAPVVKPAEPDPGFERININTARAVEIMEALRISKNAAYAITAYRKKNGPIKSLEELLDLPYWGDRMFEKHRDEMEL